MLKYALTLGLVLAPAIAQGTVITFPPGTPIQATYGTGGTIASEYVDIEGWRFEAAYNSLAIFDGGLFDGGAFGISYAMKITRLDGQAFSVGSITLEGHAGFACYQGFCGYDSATLTGYVPGGQYPIWESFAINGYVNTDTTYDVMANDPAFGNVHTVWLEADDEAFILKSITLNVVSSVPEAETYAMMLAGLGLLGLVRRGRRVARYCN